MPRRPRTAWWPRLSSSSSDGSNRPPVDLLEIGRIEKAHGLRGEVVVSLLTNLVEARTAPGIELGAGDRTLTVLAARPHGKRWLVTFDGVTDRPQADSLRGLTLKAPPLTLEHADPGPPSATSEHGTEVVALVHDLIGRHLVDQRGVDHGPVVSVIDNPASDLLELDDGRLVPLTFYRGHDPETGAITVDVPDGLLDAIEE